ncbi:MAG: ribonuclease P protein component [Muribaculaceae bacterium]|nr:ribonuclease P protein component [Muribaculaceae bacterium]
MQGQRLYKCEKLCSRTAIERLFGEGNSAIAFPLRAVYRFHDSGESPARFLITIPKKRIRHAVERVLLRRRVREAYRLCRRQVLYPALTTADISADIAFHYLSNDIADYHTIAEKMNLLLERIAQEATDNNA